SGDVTQWCQAFWSANIHLKHEPNYRVDDQRLIDLALSSRYVLLAGLLDRIARSRSPSQALFRNTSSHSSASAYALTT
ncbi:MAG: hypothetical protein M3Q82_11180, partial [Actinomycetota bacterium]|nr:hypothetical protein [Actinomycetota bacterium]